MTLAGGDTTVGPARASAPATPARGTVIGRFLVLEPLGRGGSGVVLSAYDPTLDRKVALKLVRTAGGDAARVLAEAQALARLSHPNVVAVHEVGVTGDQVFIAMELIDGVTLEAWQAETPRSLAAIVDAYVAAARGLAAAHRAGLVHRDFKPRNVMVGGDGRVCLLDFGIAGDADAAESGEVRGTPRYMSPEQARGEPVDARGDQFSFCVALDEASTGARRPARLAAAIRRGRHAEPAQRFPSMDELIAALAVERKPVAGFAAAGGAVALAAALWAVNRGDGDHRATCPDPALDLAATWSSTAPARQRLTAAIDGDPARALAAADEYAAAWIAMRGESCTAQLAGRETAHLHDLRTLCLDERRAALEAVVDTLAAGRADAGRATLALRSLPELSACGDPAWLLARVKPPAPEVAAAVAAVRKQIEQSQAQLWLGRYAEGLATARQAAAQAAATAYRPALAEATGHLAVMLSYTGARTEARDAFREAARIGMESGHYELTAKVWARSIYIVGIELGDRDAGHDAAANAMALAAGLPRNDGLRASVLAQRGSLLATEHRHDEAIADLREALAIRSRTFGPDHPQTGFLYLPLANALYDRGDYQEALEVGSRGRDLFRTHISELHPEGMRNAKLVAAAQLQLGNEELAAAELAALVPLLPSLGQDPFGFGAMVEEDLGRALRESGRPEEAIAHQRAAVAGFEARSMSNRAVLAQSELAHTLLEAGHPDEAGALHAAALARGEQLLARDAAFGTNFSISLQRAGTYHRTIGEPRAALALYERAMPLRAGRGPTHRTLCDLLPSIDEVRATLHLPVLEHPVRATCPAAR